jgi:uncharacterized protein YjbJ (UPF0337 family)
MTWDQIEKQWEQWKLAAKEQWSELTDDDLNVIGGHRETLVGKLQQRYGIAAEQAARRVDYWLLAVNAPQVRERR